MEIEKMFAAFVQESTQNKIKYPLSKRKLLYVVNLMLQKSLEFQRQENELLYLINVSNKSLKNLNNNNEKITLLELYLIKKWLYYVLYNIKEFMYVRKEQERNREMEKMALLSKDFVDFIGSRDFYRTIDDFRHTYTCFLEEPDKVAITSSYYPSELEMWKWRK